METSWTRGIGGWMDPFISPVTHEGRRGWTTQKVGRHNVVPRLAYWVRAIAHTERGTEPRTVSIQV